MVTKGHRKIGVKGCTKGEESVYETSGYPRGNKQNNWDNDEKLHSRFVISVPFHELVVGSSDTMIKSRLPARAFRGAEPDPATHESRNAVPHERDTPETRGLPSKGVVRAALLLFRVRECDEMGCW